MGNLVLNGATSGATTITPTDAVTTTLTLPTTTGTLALSSSIGVIQVKQGQTSTQQSFSNNTWTDLTGLTVNITPTSSSNKILVLATVWINSDTGSANLYGRLNRNGTIVGTASNDTAGYAGNGGWRALSDGQDASYNIHNIGFTWLDSPASTSTLTYKIQGLTNAGNFFFNKSGSGSAYFYMYSTITVMEVTP